MPCTQGVSISKFEFELYLSFFLSSPVYLLASLRDVKNEVSTNLGTHVYRISGCVFHLR